MDSIKEKSSADPFPFESLRRFHNLVSPNIKSGSQFTARSFDNRGRVSDVAGELRAKLGAFRTRLSSSSFLSNEFAWQVKTATSSDTQKLLAKAGQASSEKTYSLEVTSLASSRQAVSDRLVSDERATLDEGTYTYDVTVGDDTHSVEVVIEKNNGVLPTNRSVLLDIERSINKLGLDITATLHDLSRQDFNPFREGGFKDWSYVSISSNDTGEKIDFSISDTSGILIESLNLDQIRQYGFQNDYQLNGDRIRKDDNEIVVETGKVTGYLLGTTDKGQNVRVSVKQGTLSLAGELEKIIEDYNEFIKWIDDNDSIISPSLKTSLFKELNSISLKNMTVKEEPIEDTDASHIGFATRVSHDGVNTVDDDLADIGLTLNNDGSISIEEEFSSFVSSDLKGVYDSLAGSNGFFTTVGEAIDAIHGKTEAGYVYHRNSVLSYDKDAEGSVRSIYQDNSSSIISLFA